MSTKKYALNISMLLAGVGTKQTIDSLVEVGPRSHVAGQQGDFLADLSDNTK